MARLLPDPTFYPSPRLAIEAPTETLAYVALLSTGENGTKDALGVIDTDPESAEYGTLVGKVNFPTAGNELHHFGWNACSSHLCAYAPNPHMERRYLIVPGTHSSRIHIVDTHPDPRSPRLVKVIEGEEVMAKTGYAAPHTVHCGPDGIYLNALGGPDGNGPGGIFMLDHDTFELRGAWERDRGPQHLAYDFWWHLGHDGDDHERVGNAQHGAQRRQPRAAARRQVRQRAARVGSAAPHAPAEARARRRAADGARAAAGAQSRRSYGFVGVVMSLKDLSSSIWTWYRDEQTGTWATRKVIEIPAEPRIRRCCRRCSGIQGRAAARDGHQPVARRPLPVRELLGHGRAAAVRRERSVRAETRRLGAHRGGSCGGRASEGR
jgi:selenium-binding protein 1